MSVPFEDDGKPHRFTDDQLISYLMGLVCQPDDPAAGPYTHYDEPYHDHGHTDCYYVFSVVSRMRDLIDENARLRAAVNGLHYPIDSFGERIAADDIGRQAMFGRCNECQTWEWPCPTIRALDSPTESDTP